MSTQRAQYSPVHECGAFANCQEWLIRGSWPQAYPAAGAEVATVVPSVGGHHQSTICCRAVSAVNVNGGIAMGSTSRASNEFGYFAAYEAPHNEDRYMREDR